MGVVSNKINIMELMKSGGGGDPTIPGRVSALETETAGLIEANAKIMTSVSDCVEAIQHVQTSVAALDLETVALAEGLQNVMTSVSSGRVPMQTGNNIRFGVDGNGDYGYYKVGADTVTPFLAGGGGGNHDSTTAVWQDSQTITFNYTNKPEYIYIYLTGSALSNTSYVFVCVIVLHYTNGAYNVDGAYGIKSGASDYYSTITSRISVIVDETDKQIMLTSSSSTLARFTSGSNAHYEVEYFY